MSPAASIMAALETAGLGVVGSASGWSIHGALEPAQPDKTITVYDTGGAMPEPDCNLSHPTVQIRARAPGYTEAYDQLAACRDELIGPTRFTAGGATYVGAWGAGDIQSLGQDDNRRFRLVMNLNLMMET